MSVLCKIFTNNINFQKSYHFCIKIRQKYPFYTYLISPIRISNLKNNLIGLRYYTTTAIETKASQSLQKTAGKAKRSDLKNLILLAAPVKWRLLSAIAFLLISSSITMSVPFCLGKVIDIVSATNKENVTEKLNGFVLILLGVFVLGALSNFCRVYIMSTTGHKITNILRKKAYAAILSQEITMFDKRGTGELVGRLTGDSQLISSAITSNLSDGLRSVIMAIGGILMMFYVSPQLALVSLSIVPPVAGLAIIYGRSLKKISKDVQDSLAVLNIVAEERISNIRTVKAFAQETFEIEKYYSKLQDVLKIYYKESLYRGIFFGITGLSGNAIVLSVLYYGGIVMSDSITIGNLSAFLVYATYVGISLNGLSSFYSELNKALGANTRLFELIDKQPLIPIQGGKCLEKELTGTIIFQNVSFAYPVRKDLWILRDFNLNIPKHSITAIVGASGSGKSTVASLLLRFYDPCKGCIKLDDCDLKELDPVWFKSQIGIVSQEPVLFSGTIKENITYGIQNVTEDDIKHVVKQAYISEFTEKMVDGLDTIVGERGITLSGGQRQRIAIARALIKKPKILILDEATSALDAQSEHLVQKALENIAYDKTVLTIAHRLSTIKNADKIIVLHQGQIVETGTYNYLINKEHGYFKNLVKHQSFT